MAVSIHIGLSGYSYREWQGEGKFYPPKLKQADYLRFYASRYQTLEAVGTFTHLPSEKSTAKWLESTPEGFRICPKMHQSVTHFKRLKPESFERVTEMLEALAPVAAANRLGPILVQLPPNLKRNDELLSAFLEALPSSFQFAVEFRNATWNEEAVEAILRSRNVAWVAADTDEDDALRRNTADFRYVRLRKSAYDIEALDAWADEIVSWGQPTYVFCRHTDIPEPWTWADRLTVRTSPS